MGAFTDLTGMVFGRLTVLARYPENTKHSATQWVCRCSCVENTEIVAIAGNLNAGVTKSCGCLSREVAAEKATSHGMYDSPEYKTWNSIKNRCYNQKSDPYGNYGARDIKMSEEWRDSFEAFYHDMGPKPTPGHTIDRRDNDKGYCKENCRWATKLEQANNRRTNKVYEYKGERKTLAQWCVEFNLNYDVIKYRLNKGMLFDVAINTIIPIGNTEYTIDGVKKTLFEWCNDNQISYLAARRKLFSGHSIESAISKNSSCSI